MNKIIYAFILVLLFSCENNSTEYQTAANDAEFLHRSMKKITDVIVHDIFSPPVASRIYTYSSIAGYEAMLPSQPQYRTLAGQLTGFEAVPQPEAGKEYCYPLASVQAMLTVGRTLIFSEEKIIAFEKEIHAEFKELGVPQTVFDNSIAYGDSVAAHVLRWASKDNYKQTRTAPKFAVNLEEEGRWQPTPPDYMEGIEPSWGKIRPFALDSAQQFRPAPPTPFSMDKNSQFYKETMEVYEAVNQLKQDSLKGDNLNIAKFWDCNPYVSTHQAHLMYATKKITPGGHWINIVSIAARKAKADFAKTAQAYTLTALCLADGFISCWDEKYRSNLVRPETVINKYIDEDWSSTLQTPPFPEYTSGHSVISSAAATALTSIFGDNFAFEDTSEKEYGLPVRSFTSFTAAAEEAAISRLYGGIHYRPAIENGGKQGKGVGKFIVEKVKFTK